MLFVAEGCCCSGLIKYESIAQLRSFASHRIEIKVCSPENYDDVVTTARTRCPTKELGVQHRDDGAGPVNRPTDFSKSGQLPMTLPSGIGNQTKQQYTLTSARP